MKPLADYSIASINTIDTPFMAVYPDVIKENIQRLINVLPDISRIRPHVKTHKCPQVVKLLLDAGITKFKCATIAEAEMLAFSGAEDILLAYQPVGPKIARLMSLIQTYPNSKFSCLVDNIVSARHIAVAASEHQITADVWIDLNVGMNRTGIMPGDKGKKLYQLCCELAGIRVKGLHAYDGHLTYPDANKRLAQAEAGFAAVEELANDLVSSGFIVPRIVAGSTPTLQFYARKPQVECSPGTFIYWDQHYERNFPELGFENAALLVTRVVSIPDATTVCMDLGYKAISSEGPADERVDMPQLPNFRIISQSEEHLVINTGTTLTPPKLGEPIYGFPYHIGLTCNLYQACVAVETHKVQAQWLHTARSR
jgi:D-serine deaminase-like pyridoxal phosphate-dependent protein